MGSVCSNRPQVGQEGQKGRVCHDLHALFQPQDGQQPRMPSPLVLEGTAGEGSPPLSPSTTVGQAQSHLSSPLESRPSDSPQEATTCQLQE